MEGAVTAARLRQVEIRLLRCFTDLHTILIRKCGPLPVSYRGRQKPEIQSNLEYMEKENDNTPAKPRQEETTRWGANATLVDLRRYSSWAADMESMATRILHRSPSSRRHSLCHSSSRDWPLSLRRRSRCACARPSARSGLRLFSFLSHNQNSDYLYFVWIDVRIVSPQKF